MKTTKIKSAFVGFFASVLLLSCGFDVPVSEKVDSPVADSAVSTQEDSTSSSNLVVVSLSAVPDSAARVIGYADPVVARYELLGAFAGEAKSSLGSWTDINTASVALVPGSWDFSLEAYDSSDKIVLEGFVSAVALTTPQAISFTVSPLLTGTGTVNVKVSWDESSLVASAKVKFAGSDQPDLDITTDAGKSSVTYVNATASSGNHWLVVTLLDSEGKTVGMAQDRVRVRANLASTGTIVIPAGKLNTIPSAPTGFTATYVENTEETASLSLTWTDNSSNEAGFEIYNGETTVASPAAGATSATITDLTRGAAYSFTIKAVNAFGESGAVTSPSAPVPGFITWNLNSGTNHASNLASYVPATLPLTLQNPTRTGYAFGGWFDNKACTGTAVKKITTGSTGNKNFWAKWTPIVYTITYNLNSGTQNAANPASYTIEIASITLASPTRTSFVFGGWYANVGLSGTVVTSIATGSTGNKTFWAKWTPIVYTITYNLNSGTQNPTNPASYTVETATITLATPTRTGRTFIGWFDNTLCTGSAFTTIPKGSTGNKVFRAKWNVVVQEISPKIGNMKYVPAGTYQRDDTPANISSVSAFLMSECQITRDQFYDIMGADPTRTTYSSGTTDPVQQTNWYHAIAFCNKLSIAEDLQPVYSVTGINFNTLTYANIPTTDNPTWNAASADWNKNGYRLPTEMEWVWAAMGATSDRTNGNTGTGVNTTGYNKAFAGSTGSNAIGDYAWYYSNSNSKTHPVKTKTANELGLCDMSGNVWEWCWDYYGGYPVGTIESDTPTGQGAASGTSRVLRGGGWDNLASGCAVAHRGGSGPYNPSFYYGFRVVRP